MIPIKSVRRIIAVVTNIILCALPVYLLYLYIDQPATYFNIEFKYLNEILFGIELIFSVVLLVIAIKAKKAIVVFLILLQTMLLLYFEIFYGGSITVYNHIFVDKLTLVMALIIGIIGSLICNYAIGYIEEFHAHHPEIKDNRRFFFFLMYTFLSAMFGIVFSNSITWIYFFWEITTICSFLLICYKKDYESIKGSFAALTMNLIGGVAFVFGIIWVYSNIHTLELDKIVHMDKEAVLFPAVLFALAGMTKSAQLPFSSWLTGAMVAPTPVSALLHSSTMVKAGVYLILKVAPIFHGTKAGMILSFIGGTTFLFASFIAISQSNAKKVLAYSTIANLGLIVACAGIDSPEAVWSAILIIIFHAVAKSLLFLSVGVIEHKIGSRDIEDMDHLITVMPKVAAMMIIGMSGMFLAPFGMLISKWVTLKAFIDFNPILAVMLAYGSAATLFFWTKWMGKIIVVRYDKDNLEKMVSGWEWFSLATLSILTLVVCILFPSISTQILAPYTREIFGDSPSADYINMIIITSIMIGLIVILPVGLLYDAYFNKHYKRVGIYFGGGNITKSTYIDSLGEIRSTESKNYYLQRFFGEPKLLITGIIISLIFICFMFGVTIL
jgi:ech hydrogenase subunit A